MSFWLLLALAMYDALAAVLGRTMLTELTRSRTRRGLLVWAAWAYLGLHMLFRRVP